MLFLHEISTAKMNDIIKTWLIKSFFFICFGIVIMTVFSSKYIEEGECAVITYYLPMDCKDYIHVILVGSSSMFLSYLFTRKSSRRIDYWIEGLIYLICMILLCYYGNNILASPEIDWPYKYHPTPYR